MRYRVLIILFALGTLGGFGSGFASLRHHHSHCRGPWSTTTASPEAPEAPVPPGPR